MSITPNLINNILHIEVDTNIDFGQGRIETCSCCVVSDIQFIKDDNKWNKLQQIIKIDSIREFKNSNKQSEKAT